MNKKLEKQKLLIPFQPLHTVQLHYFFLHVNVKKNSIAFRPYDLDAFLERENREIPFIPLTKTCLSSVTHTFGSHSTFH